MGNPRPKCRNMRLAARNTTQNGNDTVATKTMKASHHQDSKERGQVSRLVTTAHPTMAPLTLPLPPRSSGAVPGVLVWSLLWLWWYLPDAVSRVLVWGAFWLLLAWRPTARGSASVPQPALAPSGFGPVAARTASWSQPSISVSADYSQLVYYSTSYVHRAPMSTCRCPWPCLAQ
jgi:hypothetical protein